MNKYPGTFKLDKSDQSKAHCMICNGKSVVLTSEQLVDAHVKTHENKKGAVQPLTNFFSQNSIKTQFPKQKLGLFWR